MVTDRRGAALTAEAHYWAAQRGRDPYDRGAREDLARVLLELQADRFPLGTVERGRHLLSIIGDAFPIPALRTAYFANLSALLRHRPIRAQPGRVVLGLGSGRCGSTTLTALLATVAESCCTHENPPLVYWPPLPEQVDFHLERFALLSRSFALVFDSAHWWLNAIDAIVERFPDAKVIGLHRELAACARSFQQRKAFGPGSINHWAPPGNAIWRTNIWDPVYPSFPLSERAETDPDGAKLAGITRYIRDYNDRLAALGAADPERVLLIATEQLAHAEAQRRIFDFVGATGTASRIALNAGTVADGGSAYFF